MMDNFITIKECLVKCDLEKLRQELGQYFEFFKDKEKQEQYVELTLKFIKEAIQLKPEPREIGCEYVVFPRCKYRYNKDTDTINFENYSVVFEISEDTNLKKCYHKEYLNHMLTSQKKYITDLDSKELLKFLLKFDDINFCMPILTYNTHTTNEILGYYLSKSIIEAYGLEKLLTLVLQEMTFYGFEVNAVKNRKIEDEMDEYIKKLMESTIIQAQEEKAQQNKTNKDQVSDEKSKVKVNEDRTEYMERLFQVYNFIDIFDNYNLLVKDYKQ